MPDASPPRRGKAAVHAEPSHAKPPLPRGKGADHPGETAPTGAEAVEVARSNEHLLPSRRTPRG